MFNKIECEGCGREVHFLLQTSMGKPLLCSQCHAKDKQDEKTDDAYGKWALKLLEDGDDTPL